MSQNRNINIMIVINTNYIIVNYPNASQDFNKPTAIDHMSQYMICDDTCGTVSGQGTADLNFNAVPGDKVLFRGISIDGNSDDAIIIYGITLHNGTNVFTAFNTNQIERQGAVVPDINTLNGLPPKKILEDFVSYDSTVMKKGIENFNVNFALYTLDTNGETQNLFGYFCWDPTINVQ